MRRFFTSIRGRIVLTGSVFFLLCASAAVYAVTRFVGSAESLHHVTTYYAESTEHAGHMNMAVDRVQRLIRPAVEAPTLVDYENAFEDLDASWLDVQEHVEAIPEEIQRLANVDLDQTIRDLDDALIALDMAKLRLLEFQEAETRLFQDLRTDLKPLQESTRRIHDDAYFKLNEAIAEIAGGAKSGTEEVQQIAEVGFIEFRDSLEMELTLTNLLGVLDRLPLLRDPDAIDDARERFAGLRDALRRKLTAIGLEADSAEILSILAKWGTGQSNIFQQRLDLLGAEESLFQELRKITVAMDRLEIESRKISAAVVDASANEVLVVEDAVGDSVNVTVALLGIALVAAAGIGWRTVWHGIVRPLRQVETAMLRIAEGDSSATLPQRTEDELGSMVGALSVLRDYVVRVTEAEKSLADTEARLRSAIDNMSGGIFICDQDLNVQMMNSQFPQMFGYPEGLVSVGSNLVEGWRFQWERGDYGDVPFDEQFEQLKALYKCKEPLTFQRVLTTGTVLEMRVAPMEGGRCVGVITDVTERTRAERALHEKEHQLRTAIDNMTGGLFMCDADLNIVLLNDQIGNMYGVPPGLLPVGQNVVEAWRQVAEYGEIDALTSEAQVNALVEMHKSGKPRQFERVLKSGRVLDERIIPMEGGGSVGTITDITENRRAQQELEAASAETKIALEQLRVSMDAMPLGVVLRDETLNAVLWNKAFLALFELDEDEWKSMPGLKSFLAHQHARGDGPDGRTFDHWWEEVEQRLSAAFASGAGYNFEAFQPASGRYLEVTNNPTPWGGLITVYRDVTEARRAEDMMRQNLEEVENFNKLAVGRELRMIELKQEINELLAGEGKEPAYEVVG